MQTVTWDDDNVPLVIVLNNRDTQIFDYPDLYCFEVGDQIQYITEVGVSCYRVVDVQPEYDDSDIQEMRRVTIRGV